MRLKTKWLVFGLTLLLSLAGPVQVATVGYVQAAADEQEEERAPEPQAARFPAGEAPNFPRPEAAAWFLFDRTYGQILAAGNEDQPLPMASTTKIMTALLLVEEAALDDVFWVPFEARGIAGSKLYLEPGERYSGEDLLTALMIASANDAAITIAVNLADSVEGFADKMNEKAAELGLANTNFVNPHGLHAADHYSSAADLTYLAATAMENEQFRRFAALTNGTVNDPIRSSTRQLNSHNLFLVRYPHATGIKTGFTSQAGFCLVAAAEKDGREVIGVILGGNNSNRVAADMEQLMDWAFAAFEPVEKLPRGSSVEVRLPGQEQPSPWVTTTPVTLLQPVAGGDRGQITTEVVHGGGDQRGESAAVQAGATPSLLVEGPGGFQQYVPLQPKSDDSSGWSSGAVGAGGNVSGAGGLNIDNSGLGSWWPLGVLLAIGSVTVFWRQRQRRLNGWRKMGRLRFRRRRGLRRRRPGGMS